MVGQGNIVTLFNKKQLWLKYVSVNVDIRANIVLYFARPSPKTPKIFSFIDPLPANKYVLCWSGRFLSANVGND